MGIYKWNDSSRFRGDVQEIGDWLDSIEVKTPENIVNEADNDTCPAHSCFTWDDHKAGHMWRLQEARLLINSIITVVDSDDREPIEIPAFESVIIDNTRQYVTIEQTFSDDDIYQQVRGETLSLVGTARRKLKALEYLRKESIDSAQKHLELAETALAV